MTPLPQATANFDAAVNGSVGRPSQLPPAQLAYGITTPGTTAAPGVRVETGGDISLDFVDTDIREVVAQILGNALHVNYAIDPSVKGTTTFRTARPLPRSSLLSTLQILLAQNGAAMVVSNGLYRIAPARRFTRRAVIRLNSDVAALPQSAAVFRARPGSGNRVRRRSPEGGNANAAAWSARSPGRRRTSVSALPGMPAVIDFRVWRVRHWGEDVRILRGTETRSRQTASGGSLNCGFRADRGPPVSCSTHQGHGSLDKPARSDLRHACLDHPKTAGRTDPARRGQVSAGAGLSWHSCCE